jgi:hypothetical protein
MARRQYDSYLLHAAGMLWNGDSDESAVSYLVTAETEYIGLAAAMGARERALSTFAPCVNTSRKFAAERLEWVESKHWSSARRA